MDVLGIKKNGLDHPFGQTRSMSRPRRGVFGSPASCLSAASSCRAGKNVPAWPERRSRPEKPLAPRLLKMSGLALDSRGFMINVFGEFVTERNMLNL